jgi:hypothetical protein
MAASCLTAQAMSGFGRAPISANALTEHRGTRILGFRPITAGSEVTSCLTTRIGSCLLEKSVPESRPVSRNSDRASTPGYRDTAAFLAAKPHPHLGRKQAPAF